MIELKNISKKFDKKILFNKYNLVIPDGAFIIFSGKSGCGKTTLLNMIGGLEKPDYGEVIVDGINIHKKGNMRKYFLYKVGFLFQNFALIEDETVEQNLEYVQKKARSKRSLDEILAYVGLSDKKKEKVFKLSGGEQQRIALSRLMYKQCDIILADEPTGSLDAENAKIVMEILHNINNEGKTIIVVTHNERIIEEEGNCIKL